MESKKNPNVDLRKRYHLFLSIGLMLSFLFVNMAFEWKSYSINKLIEPDMFEPSFYEIHEVPVTVQPPPPPPQVSAPKILPIPDEKIAEEIPKLTLEPVPTAEVDIDELILKAAPKDEEVDKEHIVVEQNAEPVGGFEAFYEYVKSETDYPDKARRMRVQGKVYLTFVIERDGSITNIEVLKGIGAGCDEEAVRVMSKAPKWIPGKQRGIPVRVRMQLPIFFRLN